MLAISLGDVLMLGALNMLTGGAAAGITAWASVHAERKGRRALADDIARNQEIIDGRLEGLKAELQQQVQNATFYSQRQHEVYADLFKLLNEADGAVAIHIGLREVPDTSARSLNELMELASAYDMVESIKTNVAELWDDEDPSSARKAMDEAIKRVEVARGDSAFRAAKNFAIVNALYLSQGVQDSVWEIVNDLAKLIAEIHVPERGRWEKKHKIHESVGVRLARLRAFMREELTRPVRVPTHARP